MLSELANSYVTRTFNGKEYKFARLTYRMWGQIVQNIKDRVMMSAYQIKSNVNGPGGDQAIKDGRDEVNKIKQTNPDTIQRYLHEDLRTIHDVINMSLSVHHKDENVERAIIDAAKDEDLITDLMTWLIEQEKGDENAKKNSPPSQSQEENKDKT